MAALQSLPRVGCINDDYALLMGLRVVIVCF